MSNWIPVTERLPEESGYFLVTTDDSTKKYVDIVWYAHPNDYDIEKGEWREMQFDDETVIAWKPLPEPYKESDKILTNEEQIEELVNNLTKDIPTWKLVFIYKWTDFKVWLWNKTHRKWVKDGQ